MSASICLAVAYLPGQHRTHYGGKRGRRGGITLAPPWAVSEIPIEPGYDEPTVMWRMSRAAGQSSHAVIDPHPGGAAVIWFVNDRPVGFRDFDDWTSALLWSEQMQAQNWTAGWRMAPE